MQDFIFRDNLELLKTKPSYVAKPAKWNGVRDYPIAQLYEPTSTTFYNNLTQAVNPSKKYINCQHCGTMLKQAGLGAHVRSLKCMAARMDLQAILDGYALAPVKYCNLTSPFARRYPTKLNLMRKAKGTISLQVYYEVWFAELWLSHAEDAPFSCNHHSSMLGSADQSPPAHLLPCFQELAAAKRRNSKRGMQQALDNLQLTLALVDK